MHGIKIYKCNFCGEEYKWEYSLKRHMKKHEGYNVDNIHHGFDLRLKENFKLFVTGPSRCGKTVFVSKLLENIHDFAKLPPTKVLYIYKVWKPKYDEIMSLGVNFMEDNDNVVNNIKSSVTGESMLVIFDDLIGSLSLKNIANLFTVDARIMNMSLVFLT